MGATTLLLCRCCRLLHPLLVRGADEETVQELASFRTAHDEHGLLGVERIPEPALFGGPTADPMSVRWFHVAGGGEVFLVRSWRASIDEPRQFELVAGAPATVDCVDVDEPLVRHALDRHFYPQAIRAAKVERVIAVLRTLTSRLDPSDVEIAFDDTLLPNTGIGPLPGRLGEELVRGCAVFLDAWELECLETFVADHREADGALAVRVRRMLDRSAA